MKIWNGVKLGNLDPNRRWKTNQLGLRMIRWSGAFLCAMGDDRTVTKGHRAQDCWNSLMSAELEEVLLVMKDVTWNFDSKNSGFELFSLTDAVIPRIIRTFLSYSFEFNSLTTSYFPRDEYRLNSNRENLAVSVAFSVALSKFQGVRKLSAIRRYSKHYRVPTNLLAWKAFS